MNFSNIIFLYYFLPCFFLVYYLVPDSFKNFVLLLGSILFYAWGEPRFVFFMILVIIIDFFSALWMERLRNKPDTVKAILVFSLFINIALLGYFKYVSFFLESIRNITKLDVPILTVALPIGISFYTSGQPSITERRC